MGSHWLIRKGSQHTKIKQNKPDFLQRFMSEAIKFPALRLTLRQEFPLLLSWINEV